MNRCEILSRQYPNTVILQLRGGFYNAYDDSALVLSEVMDYKLTQSSSGKYKSGFPINALDKVIRQFKNFHIDTIVFDNDKIVDNIIFDDNEFLNYLSNELRLIDYNKPDIVQKKREKLSQKKDISYSSEIEFLSSVCDGRNPYTNEITNSLDLNNVNTIRTLYKIRDALLKLMKEGDSDE